MIDLRELSVEDTKAIIEQDPKVWIDAYMELRGNPEVDDLKYGSRFSPVNGFDIKSVHEEGDCEGGGDHSEIVYAIIYGGAQLAHFRYTGFYSSYNGTEWTEGYEIVYPREVVVTQYHTTRP